MTDAVTSLSQWPADVVYIFERDGNAGVKLGGAGQHVIMHTDPDALRAAGDGLLEAARLLAVARTKADA